MTKRFLFMLLFTVTMVFGQSVPRIVEHTPFTFEWEAEANLEVRVYTVTVTGVVSSTPIKVFLPAAIQPGVVNSTTGQTTFSCTMTGMPAGNQSFVMTRVKDGIESDYSNVAAAQFRPDKGGNFKAKP